MVVLRATQKVLRALPQSTRTVGASDTALCDWYVNRLVVDRQPLLILVSSCSLLSLLNPARDVRALPDRLSALVAARLYRLGIAQPLIDAEVAAMDTVAVAKTLDRSVVGTMVDFALMIPSYLRIDGWDETTLPLVEARLAATPCRASGRAEAVTFPEQAVPRLLAQRWPAG